MKLTIAIKIVEKGPLLCHLPSVINGETTQVCVC